MNGEEKKTTAVIQDIPGIAAIGAQQIITVIGTDMFRFSTDAHISSWAGLDNVILIKKKAFRHGENIVPEGFIF